MKKYYSIFRIKFLNGIQYRTAAVAGCATQFFWGVMEILLYRAFYDTNPAAFPMEFSAMVSYIWLQQAFLALFATWVTDNEIFNLIANGNVSYELCRPFDLYTMWFTRNVANRVAKAVLRCFPILLVAVLLPAPYGISFPKSTTAFLLFLLSAVLAVFVIVAFFMLIYITTFYTISPLGVRVVSMSVIEFFSGAVIPLPFFPDWLQNIVQYLPFASMQNVPLRIYSGDIAGQAAYFSIFLQIVWIIFLVLTGKLFMRHALEQVVIQGG